MTSSGQCSTCTAALPRTTGRGRTQLYCAPCAKARQPSYGRTAKAKRAAIISAAKDRPCVDCGVQYPQPVMDLDHVRGEKAFTIASRVGASLAALHAEIAKCDVRCANCHRLRHHNENANKAATAETL